MCDKRHYYRCVDCLTVSAADEYLPKVECGVCGGAVDWMGRVHKARLVQDEIQCACDARCTFARGPSCDCRCGGKNHGQGVLVTVLRDCGPVPRLGAPSGDNRKAAATAAEWRAALAALTAAIDQYEEERRQNSRMDYERFRQWQRLLAYRYKARKSRSHKHRMAAIGEALPSYQAAATVQTALF